MNLFREKGESICWRSQESFDELRAWAGDLLREGKVRSVWIGEDVYVAAGDHALYSCLHHKDLVHGPVEKKIVASLGKGHRSVQELTDALHLDKGAIRESLRRLAPA